LKFWLTVPSQNHPVQFMDDDAVPLWQSQLSGSIRACANSLHFHDSVPSAFMSQLAPHCSSDIPPGTGGGGENGAVLFAL
jgi:hypothetical protein